MTNGKAERFIQSALREWADGHAYANSDQRHAALPLWNHFYNWHRPHYGIGCQTPSSRLPGDGNNVLTLHKSSFYQTILGAVFAMGVKCYPNVSD